jgi:hypothetical protein
MGRGSRSAQAGSGKRTKPARADKKRSHRAMKRKPAVRSDEGIGGVWSDRAITKHYDFGSIHSQGEHNGTKYE